MLDLIRGAVLPAEVVLSGARLLLRDLMNLEEGDVVSFESAVTKPVDLMLNGARKYQGDIVGLGRRAAFRVGESVQDRIR